MATRGNDGAGGGSFADELAGLLAEFEAWDDEVLDGLGRDTLGAALAAFEARDEADEARLGATDDGAGSVSGAAVPGGLLASARLLATTAVQSLLADRCAIIRGTCPHCERAVAFQGCGQEPELHTSISDVATLKRYERELQRQDDLVAVETGPARATRSARDVATRAAQLLDELGGLDRLRVMFERRKPEGSTT